MSKTDVKEIVLTKYPEIGDDKYVPKLPDISEAALIELEAIIFVVIQTHPGTMEHTKEIIAFIDNIKDERTKR